MTQQLLLHPPAADRLLESFVEDCKIRGLNVETIRRYRGITEQFVKFIAESGVGPVDVNKHHLQDYIRARRAKGIGQKTLENELSGISSFYGYLAFEDYVGKNPVPEVRKRYLTPYKKEMEGDEESPRKLISVEEMSLLINSIVDTRDKAILTLLAKTGDEADAVVVRCGVDGVVLDESVRALLYDDSAIVAVLLRRLLEQCFTTVNYRSNRPACNMNGEAIQPLTLEAFKRMWHMEQFSDEELEIMAQILRIACAGL